MNGGFIVIINFISTDLNGNTVTTKFFHYFELAKNIVTNSTYSNGQVFRCLKIVQIKG